MPENNESFFTCASHIFYELQTSNSCVGLFLTNEPTLQETAANDNNNGNKLSPAFFGLFIDSLNAICLATEDNYWLRPCAINLKKTFDIDLPSSVIHSRS